MANQPTKYSKFLVGAASAALVATAVAPVASAADFKDTKGNTHEEAIKALSAAGVISGYADGTFKPNKTLTRSDVVKMMGKWLVSEGYKVPTDYKTNVRFTDLKSTSNDELLQYAAVVKDNGVFIGSNDRLLAGDDISRENMAVVIVRAFDRVHDIDLASYVAGQDFKKDVTDLGKAKAEARPAIDVLDFFDITNPAAPAFNPKATTTRGQFASFLNKTLTADFSKVTGQVAEGVASVKAVNATTVEVEMKDVVTNISSLNFKIDGLTVSNAAVKQTNNKTVVLTTAVQKGGEKYTVTLNEKAIGNFTGISNVLPEKVSMITTSQQGVVGNQVTVRAEVTVAKDESKAGIPVTFNIVSDNKSINKDHVVEIMTNADGIAEYSYTQYAAAKDDVIAYATGKANVRTAGVVYWAASAQLTIKDITEATTLVNGSKKVYEINSAQNRNGYVFVAFAENVNVAPDKAVTGAKVEGVTTYVLDSSGKITATAEAKGYPYAYTTGGKAVTAVKLDATGKANLVVTGSNATVTPVVYSTGFVDATKTLVGVDASWSATLLQDKASTVKFELKHELGLTIKAEGVQNAATYKNSVETGGRDYTVTYADKDGKFAAPGTKVKVAIDTTGVKGSLYLLDSDGKAVLATKTGATNYYEVAVEKDGKASFTVASTNVNDFVTPVAFIDNGKTTGNGVLDTDDLQAAGEITYFVASVQYAAELAAVDRNGVPVSAVIANGTEFADFEYHLVDQNGKLRSSTDATTVSFEVKAGTGIITVTGSNGTQTVQPGGTATVNAVIPAGATKAAVRVVAQNPSAVTVTATGSRAGVVLPSTNPGSVSVNFSQYGTAAITGTVTAYDTNVDTITIGNTVYSYAGATYMYNGSVVTKSAFVGYITQGNAKVSVTKDAAGKFMFNVLDSATANSNWESARVAINNALSKAEVLTQLGKLDGFSTLIAADKDAIASGMWATVSGGTPVANSAAKFKADYDLLLVNPLKTVLAVTELNKEIVEAQAIHNAAVEGIAVGQYAVGSKLTLQNAINAAKTSLNGVVNGTVATSTTNHTTTLGAAKSTLVSAETAFETAKVTDARVELGKSITAAEALVTAAKEGTKAGEYAVGSVGTLATAITAAKAVYDPAYSSNSSQVAAKTTLDAAIATLATKKVAFVEVTTDATGLILTFTPALQAAITAGTGDVTLVGTTGAVATVATSPTTTTATITLSGTPVVTGDIINIKTKVTNALTAASAQEDVILSLEYNGTKWIVKDTANFVAK